ncbi:hypothetical protein QAD02_023308 [Eretmocerus hayati]|uniref:Uncharacterized protein n=1 Tax=Eretmocerus hayati TaxID=131215 RepID=A0ACC2PXY0_9HYME|nr:hypothetical protein QAD02_023308 [Eretmocerus hayati]
MPLKSLHSRSMRRHLSPEGSVCGQSISEEEAPANGFSINGNVPGSESTLDHVDSLNRTKPLLDDDERDKEESDDGQDEDVTGSLEDIAENAETAENVSDESEAPLSERAASCFSESPSIGSPRVQFEKIREEDSHVMSANETDEDEKKSRRHHKDHKSGAGLPGEVGGPLTSAGHRRVSVQPDEASTLQELDIDDLESHRSDDPRGWRRHKASHPTVQIARKHGGIPHDTFKKMYDHSPHEVFVQLDELHGVGEEREWRETARWIKYEEDVEEGADRWGRPHVASLSFHSLLNLRRCLETGVVLLDLEEKDLPGLAYRVVEQMVIEELILPEDRPVVMRALLLRHRHVHDHDRGFRFGAKRNYSTSYSSLQSIWFDEDDASREGAENNNLNDSKPKIVASNHALDNNHTAVDMREEVTFTSSNDDIKRSQNEYILKRIPSGAEATVVLVGAVDFLDQPTIAFVRLAEGILMPAITEVTIPVRFMFTLLGPRNSDLDYHEIGRSISTLMANPAFHKIAYKANERRILLSAINEFLDDSIVLPPGDWERQALLPFDELKAKSEAIRRRKAKAIEDKKKQQTQPSESAAAKKALLAGEDEKKPPADDDDPLRRTHRLFGGLINDIKRRYPHYVSDFTDGLSSSCLAAAIFMYFAALCTAITFGGLMSDKTNNVIGISETLVSCSFTGIIMALFATQPLVIIGLTGPLLLFDESLYKFCQSTNIDFLTVRVYVGGWMSIIALLIASVEGSVLVRLFTRFTEEIFTGLISILYIVETFMKLINYFKLNPLQREYCSLNSTNLSHLQSNYNPSRVLNYNEPINNTDVAEALANISNFNSDWSHHHQLPASLPTTATWIPHPNTALMCVILCLGTFLGAYYLRIFRNSHYLGRSARRAFGDFGVPISIVTFVAIDYISQVDTEKLFVPEGLSPTQAERDWFVPLDKSRENVPAVPVWMMFACAIPAMLAYILVFMETQISELIIDKKERKLRKGNGYHMDIVVVCLMNFACGLIGAPFCCAASVRSLTHVNAVTVMSTTHAPGDKPHIVEVKEQRVSALLVAILVGVSVLMSPLLRLVPMAVLLGVFLYMGISSTNGVQLFDRVKLFFMPVKHHGTANYVRRVQTCKMHAFTSIQIACLATLWIVKSTKAALALPFFLILMIPLRAQMSRCFSPAELRALDSKNPQDFDEDEPDFYEEAPLPG